MSDVPAGDYDNTKAPGSGELPSGKPHAHIDVPAPETDV